MVMELMIERLQTLKLEITHFLPPPASERSGPIRPRYGNRIPYFNTLPCRDRPQLLQIEEDLKHPDEAVTYHGTCGRTYWLQIQRETGSGSLLFFLSSLSTRHYNNPQWLLPEIELMYHSLPLIFIYT
jgi:hypothetical protein